MSRRKRIHGRRRKRSAVKFAATAAMMQGMSINGAIGAFDKQKAAEDRASEPDSAKEGDYMTRTEVRGLVNRSIKGQTPAQPKQNKASEAQAAQKDAVESAKGASKKENPMSMGSLSNIGRRMLRAS